MRKDNYPFEEDSERPLQLRRGSDAEARRSLIEKYDTALNKESGEISYNLANKDSVAESSMIRLEEDLRNTRNKRIKIGLIAGGIVLLITGIILAITLSGGDKNPDTPVNPVNPQNPMFSINPYLLGDV